MTYIGKHIGTFFVWMSMLIIIGHSVVPHHHHSDTATCHHTCAHDADGDQTSDVASLTGHQCQTSHDHDDCESCQFETTATTPLTKIALGSPLLTSALLQLVIFPEPVIVYFDSWSNHYSFDFTDHSLSRGPPALG